MASALQITLRDMRRSDALESRIRRALAGLDRVCPGIIACRVVVEVPHHHWQQGRQFVVRLNLAVPGGEIVVNRDHHEDIYIALGDTFAAARRRLDDYARRRRREVKSHRISRPDAP